ncbi:hypothetical protein QAD02_014122 [Eretmocerus hayati]|uniref:Uncharacterized protein n=1 Tax=Eretmocerus hayati TaxID=131215 RepID=A0ACC2P4M7_9HYME|nr:hypothetical protein QAD02_014122 [Eretmocerus hayati]
MMVSRFIRQCKDAEKLVDPSATRLFLMIVESKITGNARPYIEYKDFETLDQLLNELKRTFTITQSLPQIQSELSRVVQKPNEKVSEFGLRVTKLLHEAIELINEKFSPVVAKGVIEGMVSSAIQCFVMGLEEGVSLKLDQREFPSLEPAISQAIEVESYVIQWRNLHGL